MMRSKLVGHFKDLSYGNASEPLLKDVRGKLQVGDDVLKLIEVYLKSGVMTAVSPGLSNDVITNEIIGTGAFLTDGVWEWHSDLGHYVEKHRVALPLEFLIHMRTMNYQIDVNSVQKKLENDNV